MKEKNMTITEEQVRALMEGAGKALALAEAEGWYEMEQMAVTIEREYSHSDPLPDAAHIAACDPQTIQALCEDWLRIREALPLVDALYAEVTADGPPSVVNLLAAMRGALIVSQEDK